MEERERLERVERAEPIELAEERRCSFGVRSESEESMIGFVVDGTGVDMVIRRPSSGGCCFDEVCFVVALTLTVSSC